MQIYIVIYILVDKRFCKKLIIDYSIRRDKMRQVGKWDTE